MRLSLLTLPLIAIAAIAASPTDSNDRGPGLPGDRHGDAVSYRVDGFEKVAFSLAGDVEVRVGGGFSVSATGPAAAFADVRVTRDDATLKIERRYRTHDGDRPLERQIHFVVTLPRLTTVGLAGSGRMSVDRVSGPAFNAAVGGSGSLALGDLAVDRAEVSIGGSGGVTARGAAHSLTVNLGGSGGLDAPALHARTARVSSAGSGRIRATVDGAAQVSVVGSGSVDLGPGARCAVSRLGKATVRCGA